MAFCCIINGPCSAGKSTLIHQLQNHLPDPNIHLGIDTFHLAIPPRALEIGQPNPDYLLAESSDRQGKPYTVIKHGRHIKKINQARFASVKKFVQHGVNVISDELLWTQNDVRDLVNGLAGIRVYLMGLFVSEEVGTHREQIRFNQTSTNAQDNYRPEGMSRASSELVHNHMIYDLTLNNDNTDTSDNIESIRHFIMTTPQPDAFNKLLKNLSK